MANSVSSNAGIPVPAPKTRAPIPKTSVSKIRDNLLGQQTPSTTTTTTTTTKKVVPSSNVSVARLAQQLTAKPSQPTPPPVSKGKRFVLPEKWSEDGDVAALSYAATEELRGVLGPKGRLNDSDKRGVVTLEEAEQLRRNPSSQPKVSRENSQQYRKAQEEEDFEIAIALAKKMHQEEEDRKFAEELAKSQ